MNHSKLLPNATRSILAPGQPGTGKSKFIEATALQDIQAGRGVGILDPHGDLFGNLTLQLAGLCSQQPELAKRVIIIDPCRSDWTVSFNPLERLPGVSQERVALFLTDVVIKLWKLDPTKAPRMVWLLTNSMLAIADLGLALPDLPRFLLDSSWRKRLLPRLSQQDARRYFEQQFPTRRSTIHEWVSPVLNKIGRLIFDPDIRQLLAGKATVSFREVLDNSLVLLVNLSKGIIGESTSALLGGLIVARLQQAALSRADSRKREPFYLYLDEFQNYTTDNIQDILSESRKYALHLMLAHQYLDQLSPELLSAVRNTVNTIACFRVGYQDAYRLVKDIFPAPDFFTKRQRDAKLKWSGSWPSLEVAAGEEPLGWQGLALLLTGLQPREFWVRRRGPYLPTKLRTRDMPDPVVTPELETQLARLLAVSGQRFGRPKDEIEDDILAKVERLEGADYHGQEEPVFWEEA